MRNCHHCNKLTSNAKFCSRKCSGQHTNNNREPRSIESRQKTGDAVKNAILNMGAIEYANYMVLTHTNSTLGFDHYIELYKSKHFFPPQEISGDYTKIYLRTCKISGIQWYSKSAYILIHPSIKETKYQYGWQARFRFNVHSYPLWFIDAKDLQDKYGWYSTPGSRRGILNVNGISRDHMYSVSDGFINGIDPVLLSHPGNCRLIRHKENQSKNTKSIITIDELLARINKFNLLYDEYTS